LLRRQTRRCTGLIALLLAALMLSACSDGGGGAGVTGSDTGTVGVLLTDGPTDRFCSIMLVVNSVVLLSDEEPVTIFEGSKRVDLLDLRDNTELITVGRGVPAGTYSKIRLGIDDEQVRLFEECDENGDPDYDAPDQPKIARLPSGKIDLNPRGEFRLRAGSLMLIQLDMDAERSIHISGPPHNEKINFRPVVFVDIYTGVAPDRLVLLRGTIEELASEPDRFDLCNTHAVSRPLDPDTGQRTMTTAENGDDDDGDDNGDDGDRDTCVEVRVVEGTSIFLAEAVPGAFGELENMAPAAVLGRFLFDGETLRVVAEIVQQDPQTVERVPGTIASEVEADVFDLEVNPDQIPDLPENLIAVLLQNGTKIFSRSGKLLDVDDLDDPPIQIGRRARVVGFVDLTEGAEQINATLVVVDLSEGSLERVSGVFLSWDEATGEMRIVPPEPPDADPEFVCVPEEASVFLGVLEDGRIEFEGSDPSEFLVNMTDVTAFGRSGVDTDCPEATFEASSVIGFDQ
jgi:hypothetical protein